jgi:hypothetical protein
MLLTANPTAPFTPAVLPSGRLSGSIWAYSLTLGSGAMRAGSVTCTVPHPGGHPHAMPALEEASWEDVELTLAAGGRATLPLDAQFLLGSFNARSGAIAPNRHRIWRLESQIDVGTAAVFAYDITHPDNPLAIADVSVLTPSTPNGRASRLWALVCCEFVLCKTRNDFEPAGVLDAARLYPLIEVLTNAETSTTKGAVKLRRPRVSPMDHGFANGGRHLAGLFADRNNNMGLVEAMLALAGKSGVAIPTWEDVFDYVLKYGAAVTQSFVMIDRQVLDRKMETTRPSTMLKLPRQGAFASRPADGGKLLDPAPRRHSIDSCLDGAGLRTRLLPRALAMVAALYRRAEPRLGTVRPIHVGRGTDGASEPDRHRGHDHRRSRVPL